MATGVNLANRQSMTSPDQYGRSKAEHVESVSGGEQGACRTQGNHRPCDETADDAAEAARA